MHGNTFQPSQRQDAYLRLPQVLAKIPISASTWWRWVKSGRAPAPIKLSAAITVWREEEINSLIKTLGAPSS